MKTEFRTEQLEDPFIGAAEGILRSCVHCGMCTATCPSYQVLGDELDSPRGRIYLIKTLLEEGRKPDEEFVAHMDRCLSCLACTTTCPSGVDYMHLIDDTRAYIHDHYRRPPMDRILRRFLAWMLPNPKRFQIGMRLASLGRPFAPVFSGRLGAMLRLAPKKLPKRDERDLPQRYMVASPQKRVAILSGCAQPILNPEIQRATVSLLNRLNVEVISPEDAGCCGALVHHMGRSDDAKTAARKNINAWLALEKDGPLDAIIINTSGCGTTVKDYAHLFAGDVDAPKAARVAELAQDITEFLLQIYPECRAPERLNIAYHAACSLQHGQKVINAPKVLLERAGFQVQSPFESHLCCGSAGTYNMLQPKIAKSLGLRKAENLERLDCDVIAAGNLGCMTQIEQYTKLPILHTVQLLDWALGGERPIK